MSKTGYLIDMDGVIYRENHLIPGAVEFVEALRSMGIPFLFLTNNSAPTPEDLAVRLNHLGILGISPRHFYTSALNTADFLVETHPGCTARCSPGAGWRRRAPGIGTRRTSWLSTSRVRVRR